MPWHLMHQTPHGQAARQRWRSFTATNAGKLATDHNRSAMKALEPPHLSDPFTSSLTVAYNQPYHVLSR